MKKFLSLLSVSASLTITSPAFAVDGTPPPTPLPTPAPTAPTGGGQNKPVEPGFAPGGCSFTGLPSATAPSGAMIALGAFSLVALRRRRRAR